MWGFFRRISTFWFILMLCGAAAYFCSFNLEFVTVTIPHYNEFKVRAALAYIVSFQLGASVVTALFAVDYMVKVYEISRLKRKIRDMEARAERLPVRTQSSHDDAA